MTLFVPENIPRYQDGVLRYLDNSFEKVRQAFSQLQKSTSGDALPATGSAGQQFFLNTTSTLYVYDGTRWVPSGGNLPRIQANLIGGQTLGNAVNTTIQWGAATVAVGATLTGSTTFTPTVRGWWLIEAAISIGAHATGQRNFYLFRNGSVVRGESHAVVNASINWPVGVRYAFHTTGSGDSFTVVAWHNAGVGLGMVAAESQFNMHYLGGGSP